MYTDALNQTPLPSYLWNSFSINNFPKSDWPLVFLSAHNASESSVFVHLDSHQIAFFTSFCTQTTLSKVLFSKLPFDKSLAKFLERKFWSLCPKHDFHSSSPWTFFKSWDSFKIREKMKSQYKSFPGESFANPGLDAAVSIVDPEQLMPVPMRCECQTHRKKIPHPTYKLELPPEAFLCLS